jgi:proteasome alpha subunit
MGVVCADGVLLASEGAKPIFGGPDSLVVAPLKLVKLSDKVLVGYAGMVSDAMTVVDMLRDAAPKREDELLSALRAIYWSHTTKKDVRPLGVALLVATTFGRPRLFEADPSGSIVECVAGCIGRGRDSGRDVLAREYRRMTLKDAGQLISMALGEGKDYEVEELVSDE